MQASRLPHRVTIEVRTEVPDGHDGFTESWVPRRRRVAAAVRPLVGRDLERAQQIDPRISHEVTLRYWRAYQLDLDAGRTRVMYHGIDDRPFELVSPPIDVDEAHDRVLLACREAAV